MNISICRDGVEIGEWSEDEVKGFFAEGRLLATDYYWKEGMAEWAELSKMIKPPPPATSAAPSLNRSEPSVIKAEDAPQKLFDSLMQKGIGRLFYICIILPLVVCLNGAVSIIDSSFRYDRETGGTIEIIVALVAMGLYLFAVYLRLKNIGNSNTKLVVLTVLAAIPFLAIPISLFCLFCPPGYRISQEKDKP